MAKGFVGGCCASWSGLVPRAKSFPTDRNFFSMRLLLFFKRPQATFGMFPFSSKLLYYHVTRNALILFGA